MDREDNTFCATGPPRVESIKDIEIRHWLLDAAIYQYSEPIFHRKRRVYLPEEVFRSPGMNERDMTKYLMKRGASDKCIKFAVSRYRKANQSEDLNPTNSISTDSGQCSDLSASADGGAWSDDRGRDSSASTNGHPRWKSLVHRFRGMFIR